MSRFADRHADPGSEQAGSAIPTPGTSDRDAALGPVTVAVKPSKRRPVAASDLMTWLLGAGRHIRDPGEFLDQLCWVLLAGGTPVWRASVHIQVLHPQLRGFAYRWWRERAHIEEIVAKHGVEQSAAFRNSPLHSTLKTGRIVRHRLKGAPAKRVSALLRELQDQGATDYLVLPLTFSSGRHQAITFATDHPAGFGEEEIARLVGILPVLALIFEVHATQFMAAELLAAYLGRKAGTQVLEGRVRRGSGEHIEAVVLVADIRDFSAVSDRLPSENVLAMLNRVFDLLVTRIQAEGGEVLKFLGDGLLAIFSVEACGGTSRAAECAVGVAQAIMAGLHQLNTERQNDGVDPVALGMGLHLGSVFFGNVGAEDRLDFTALGPVVNLAFRLEALTKALGSAVIVSAEFAAACPTPMIALGRHLLDGSGEKKLVFAPVPE